jgi:hypothetical protein
MMSTDGGISTQLNICITFTPNYHTISLFKGDKVVNFGLFIIALVNRVKDKIGFFEFGKLY